MMFPREATLTTMTTTATTFPESPGIREPEGNRGGFPPSSSEGTQIDGRKATLTVTQKFRQWRRDPEHARLRVLKRAWDAKGNRELQQRSGASNGQVT